MRYDSETAAAYTFIMVVVLIFMAALIFAYMTPALNSITSIGMNPLIEKGSLSEQTVFVYNWNIQFFAASIGIGLLGFAIFAICRSIEVSSAGDE